MNKKILESYIRRKVRKMIHESTNKAIKFVSYPENEPPDDKSLFLLLGSELNKAVGFYNGDGTFDAATEIGKSRVKINGKLVKYFAI